MIAEELNDLCRDGCERPGAVLRIRHESEEIVLCWACLCGRASSTAPDMSGERIPRALEEIARELCIARTLIVRAAETLLKEETDARSGPSDTPARS